MKNTTALIFLISSLSAAAWAGDPPAIDGNFTGRVTDPAQVCMNKRTVQPHTSYTEVYEGKTYHFCCTMCQAKFKANPEEVRWATDPVKHKKVDKADAFIYSYQGRAYFFSSERSLKKFAKKPTKYKDN